MNRPCQPSRTLHASFQVEIRTRGVLISPNSFAAALFDTMSASVSTAARPRDVAAGDDACEQQHLKKKPRFDQQVTGKAAADGAAAGGRRAAYPILPLTFAKPKPKQKQVRERGVGVCVWMGVSVSRTGFSCALMKFREDHRSGVSLCGYSFTVEKGSPHTHG